MSCNAEDNDIGAYTTFPIAVEKKGQCHELVELRFASELKYLKSKQSN